jgi:hypothetical protein
LLRTAIENDATLADSIAGALSDIETGYIKNVKDAEVSQIGGLSTDKITLMGGRNDTEIGHVQALSGLETTAIKTNADTAYGFVTAAADTDAQNEKDLFDNFEIVRRNAISEAVIAGDTSVNNRRVALQTSLDGIEVQEISDISSAEVQSIKTMSGIETQSTIDISGIEVNDIGSSADQRVLNIQAKSKAIRDNDDALSGIKVASIKALSGIKVKGTQDRMGIERLSDTTFRKERIRVIDAERDLRVGEINTNSKNRDKAYRDEADRSTQAQIDDANTKINLTDQYNQYVKDVKKEASKDINGLAKEAAFYAANTAHRNVKYTKKEAPEPKEYTGTPVGEGVDFTFDENIGLPNFQ